MQRIAHLNTSNWRRDKCHYTLLLFECDVTMRLSHDL